MRRNSFKVRPVGFNRYFPETEAVTKTFGYSGRPTGCQTENPQSLCSLPKIAHATMKLYAPKRY